MQLHWSIWLFTSWTCHSSATKPTHWLALILGSSGLPYCTQHVWVALPRAHKLHHWYGQGEGLPIVISVHFFNFICLLFSVLEGFQHHNYLFHHQNWHKLRLLTSLSVTCKYFNTQVVSLHVFTHRTLSFMLLINFRSGEMKACVQKLILLRCFYSA